MTYYRTYTAQYYELPKLVYVAADHIRIDDVVIRYSGISKIELEWLKENALGWMKNPSDKDNREWVNAIMYRLQERLMGFL